MNKVYGYSDDLLYVEGYGEIDCFDSIVLVRFSDGTLIKAGYKKNGEAIWWIKICETGSAKSKLTECFDEDAIPYSDVFEIDADYVWHEVKDRE